MINNEYKIEIYAESTIEGIIESFKNLKDVGMQGYIEIENKKIQKKHIINVINYKNIVLKLYLWKKY